MENFRSKYDAMAQRVLAEYAFDKPQLAFLGHSDNVTYQVTTDSDTYLLRIHIPITITMGTHGSKYEMVNSEVQWLQALARETNLTLQKPVSNRSGALVTQFSPDGDAPINCTLLSWVDGTPYHRNLESEETVYQIGAILAALHKQASQWALPEGFERPKRDRQYFTNMLKSLAPAVEDGRISRPDYTELTQSVDRLIDRMVSLDECRQFYGIMHADAHKGNMLYHQGQIRLIDFSFCAFGNYMFDLGICLSDMKDELRPLCLEGYQSVRELPENYRHLIEGFYIGSMVGTFAYLAPNPDGKEILARKVPQIARDYARKYNRGEPFWFFG